MRRTEIERSDATPLSALPLGVIALTFFLPMVRDCDEAAVSPLHESMKSPASFLFVGPTFVSAAVLCVAIVYTFATKRSATRLALLTMAWSVLVAAVGIVIAQNEKLVFVASAVSAPLFGLAWAERGLRRLALLVDAYLFASFPLALLVGLTGEYFGAYVLVGAYVTLALTRAFALARRVRTWRARRAIVVEA